MKLFNNKQLMFRVIAAVAESILFYIGFLFANQIVNGSNISIAFFILIALCDYSSIFRHIIALTSVSKASFLVL
ncbi:MAG TPA: hypothetical protein VEF53_21455 [Patescibacteria group bacterium]|nr:hypothetical protein [Patescibacteria group bacterium]